MRVRESLGDDPMLQACAFAYCSDEYPLGTALLAHPVVPDWDRVFTASLDHAIWFHRPLRADDWLLYELRGGGVADSRGLAFGRVFDRDGVARRVARPGGPGPGSAVDITESGQVKWVRTPKYQADGPAH